VAKSRERPEKVRRLPRGELLGSLHDRVEERLTRLIAHRRQELYAPVDRGIDVDHEGLGGVVEREPPTHQADDENGDEVSDQQLPTHPKAPLRGDEYPTGPGARRRSERSFALPSDDPLTPAETPWRTAGDGDTERRR